MTTNLPQVRTDRDLVHAMLDGFIPCICKNGGAILVDDGREDCVCFPEKIALKSLAAEHVFIVDAGDFCDTFGVDSEVMNLFARENVVACLVNESDRDAIEKAVKDEE